MPHHAPPMHGAVDLAAVKAGEAKRQQFELQHEALTNEALGMAGLLCPCGQRLRGAGIQYFVVRDVDRGARPGVNVAAVTVCRKGCEAARDLEATMAIARRDTASGAVTWLDEKRTAKAASQQ